MIYTKDQQGFQKFYPAGKKKKKWDEMRDDSKDQRRWSHCTGGLIEQGNPLGGQEDRAVVLGGQREQNSKT